MWLSKTKMGCKMSKIIEITAVIKARSKTIVNSFLEIGKDLIELKEACKLEQVNFEEHIKKEFSFGIKHAYKLIEVFEKFGEVASMRQIGITKLIILTHVPEEKIEEFIGLAKELPVRQLNKIVSGIGQESTYSPNLSKTERKEDYILRLKRQLNDTLQIEYDTAIQKKQTTRKNHEDWLKSAVKEPELSELIHICTNRLKELE